MKFQQLPILLSLIFAASTVAAQETTVDVRGIRIVGEGYGNNEYGSAELRAFNWMSGTSIALIVQHPAGGMIEIDKDASNFTDFSDDKGTKLDAKKSRFGDKSVKISFPKVSKDGKAALVEVNTSGIPAKGASEITLKGTVIAVTGSETMKAKSETVALKKGGKITVGEFTFSIDDVGKPDFGDDALSVELGVKGDTDKIASFTFLKPDGSEIKTNVRGTSSMSFGKLKSITKTLALAEKADSVILQLELWKDRKKIEIPVDVKATVGL